MTAVLHDARFAMRMIARDRLFAFITIVTLSLSIGATSSVFSIFKGVVLDPLPYPDSSSLIAIYQTTQNGVSSVSYPNFLDWRGMSRSLDALAAYRSADFNLRDQGRSERVSGAMVTANLFSVLGAKPLRGRLYFSDEDRLGGPPVAIISAEFWKERLSAPKGAVGTTLDLNGTQYTVIGIVPDDFAKIGKESRYEVFTLLGQWGDPTFRSRSAPMGMSVIGRLKKNATLSEAGADMQGIARELARMYPDADAGQGVSVVSLQEDVVGSVRPALLQLLGAVGFVLLIASTNIANLHGARARKRLREFAIRSSLGASRAQILRQLLTETLLISLISGTVGIGVAFVGTRTALHWLPQGIPRTDEVRIDGGVLLFTLAVSLLTSVLVSVIPILGVSRANLNDALKDTGQATTRSHSRTGTALVGFEVAITLVLLIGAGLLLRSLANLWAVELGFDPHHVLTLRLSSSGNGTPGSTRAMWRQLSETLNGTSGVQAASISAASVPMGNDTELPFWIEGQPKPTKQEDMKLAVLYLTDPQYLAVMNVPLTGGRFLSSHDNEHSRIVVVIDEEFARTAFPNQNPIGKHVSFDLLDTTAEVVGTVRHVKQWGPEWDAQSTIKPQCYLSVYQAPDKIVPLIAGDIAVMVRTAGLPLARLESIRTSLSRMTSGVTTYDANAMEAVLAKSSAKRRLLMMLVGVFATVALVMACVGVYGLMSFLAASRTREIGIRMALGATRADVLWMFLSGILRTVSWGAAIGVLATVLLSRILQSLVFGISPHDPVTIGSIAVLLIAIALGAALLPALRATRLNPVAALKEG
jgi:predicted permease